MARKIAINVIHGVTHADEFNMRMLYFLLQHHCPWLFEVDIQINTIEANSVCAAKRLNL